MGSKIFQNNFLTYTVSETLPYLSNFYFIQIIPLKSMNKILRIIL